MTSAYSGYMGRVLDIDLTTGKTGEYPVSDRERELFLGGKFMSTKILLDQTPAGIDPLSEENILIIMTSPLNGTGAPSSSRYDISAKSPQTGAIGHSNSGGNFGIFLKRAGWDGAVIRGKAKKPVYIEITEENVEIMDAKSLWGKNTRETQETMLDGRKGGSMAIGIAGENLVKFASIVSEERSHGRTGMGAVMGSKNLKGMIALGSRKPEIRQPEAFKKTVRKWIKALQAHPATGEYSPKYGTAFFLTPLSKNNTLPTKNFTSGTFEGSHKISGEYLAEKYLLKNSGCLSCPIRCARVVEHEGKEIKGPEYEILCLMGSNIMNDDIEKIIQWNYELDLLGMDSISTGTILGFAMELNEKGIWNNGLEFGKTDNISDILQKMARRDGMGNDLAEGVRFLSKKYGGADFAPHAKGLEIAGYSPRGTVGQGMGYAVSPRGACHLDAGYTVYFEVTGPVVLNQFHQKSKPPYVVLDQNMFGAISAAGNCLFTGWPILPGPLYKIPEHRKLSSILSATLTHSSGLISGMLKLPPGLQKFDMPGISHTRALREATGMKMDFGRFMEIGERGYTLDRIYNLREGIDRSQDTLAKRFTDEPLIKNEKNSVVRLDQQVPIYYSLRGWDKNGIPKEKTLRKLDLDFIDLKEILSSLEKNLKSA